MSKRNLILLIIFLAIAGTAILFLFSSFKPFSINQNDQVEDTNFVSKFFPFGKSSKTTTNENDVNIDTSGSDVITNNEQQNNKLNKISELPVAGYGIYMKERFKEVEAPTTPDSLNPEAGDQNTKTNKKTTKPTSPPTEFIPNIRFVDRISGNIYETFADKIEVKKFTNLLIPQVYDAYFGNNGESVIMRYLKSDGNTIETMLGILPKEKLGEDISEGNIMSTYFLPENISDMSISSDSKKGFYLFNSKDTAIGINIDMSGSKKIQVFNSPFTEWLTSFPNQKTISLTTKPGSDVPGYMYILNPDSKNLTKILSGINGLTTLISPDGKFVLYSGGDLSLKIYDINKKTTITTGARTLPEKCTWNEISTLVYCSIPKYSEQNNFPDAWYMGKTSFDDEIWKIELSSGNATFITDPSQLPGGESIDGIKLSVDSGENYLFFINKINSSLWELKLK